MRILVVSEVPSHPPTAGNRKCIQAYCTALAAEGHKIEFLYVYRPWTRDSDALSAMTMNWGDALHLYRAGPPDRVRQLIDNRIMMRLGGAHRWSGSYPLGLASCIRSVVEHSAIDAVIVNYWNLVPAVEHLYGIQRILFTHDRFAERFQLTGDPWLSTDLPTESRAFAAVDAVIALQDQEAEDFRARTDTGVFTAYTFSPIHELPPGPVENLLFLGSPHPENVAAMREFIEDTFSEIRARIPKARLIVAGGVCRMLSTRAAPGVVLQGAVEDLSSFYSQGAICVNPVRLGTGLKIKMCEAFAYGRPVFGDSHCLTGVPLPNAAPLIPCNTPGEYINALALRIRNHDQLMEEHKQALTYIRAVNDLCVGAFTEALKTTKA